MQMLSDFFNPINLFIGSVLTGFIIFLYGISLFKKYSFVEVYNTVKITPALIFKEHIFYVFYILLAIVGGFFIETTSSLIFYIIVNILAIFISLFEGSDGTDLAEVGTVERKEGGEWKFDFNKIVIFIGYAVVLYLSYIIFTQEQFTEVKYIGLAGPAIYPIIYFIGFTDGKHKYILERFLFLLLGVGLIVSAMYFKGIVDMFIICITMISVFMIVVSIIDKFAGKPILGYMDLPVIIALTLSLYGHVLTFIIVLLVYTFFQGIYNGIIRKQMSDRNFSVGFFGAAIYALIITYIVIYLVY